MENNDPLINEITKARECSFLGLYDESLNRFKKGIELIEEKYNNCYDRDTKESWLNLKKKIVKEINACEKLSNMVYKGILNENKNKNNHQNNYDDRHINKIKKLPFNRNPFEHHHYPDSNNMKIQNDNFVSNNNYHKNYRHSENNNNNRNNYNSNNMNYMPNIPGVQQGYNNYAPQNYYNQPQKDPEVWDPPSPRKQPKKSKKNSNPNPGNNYIDRHSGKRNYDKPWAVPEKKKNKNNENEPKESKFLLHHYPDGNGPDVDLIRLIEKDIIDTDPKIKFTDIAGHDQAKAIIKENVLMPLKMKKFFSGIREPSRGVLLYGPPGTGKTMLAKAVATTGSTTFFNVNPSTLASKWKGDSEKLVRILFEMANFYAPTTIFIDEVDSMLSERSSNDQESNRKVKTQFFIQIDGIQNKTEEKDEKGNIIPKNVIILAATNRPWDLDEAILRRLDKRIYIPLPNASSRKLLFELKLKELKLSNKIDWDLLVKKTDGFNADDIKNLCKDAAITPLRNFIKKNGTDNFDELEKFEEELINQEITMVELKEALKNVKSSASAKFLKQYDDWTENFAST